MRVLLVVTLFACTPTVARFSTTAAAPGSLVYPSAITAERTKPFTVTPTFTASGVISSTASTVTAPASYKVSAANDIGAASTTFTLRVAETAPVVAFAGSPFTFVIGETSDTGPPASTGGPILTCTAPSGFPSGLQVNAQTCEVVARPPWPVIPPPTRSR